MSSTGYLLVEALRPVAGRPRGARWPMRERPARAAAARQDVKILRELARDRHRTEDKQAPPAQEKSDVRATDEDDGSASDRTRAHSGRRRARLAREAGS